MHLHLTGILYIYAEMVQDCDINLLLILVKPKLNSLDCNLVLLQVLHDRAERLRFLWPVQTKYPQLNQAK